MTLEELAAAGIQVEPHRIKDESRAKITQIRADMTPEQAAKILRERQDRKNLQEREARAKRAAERGAVRAEAKKVLAQQEPTYPKSHSMKKIGIGKMLELRINHKLSTKEIAKYFGCNPNNVSAQLHKYMAYLPTGDDLGKMDSARGDFIRATFFSNLSLLTDPAKQKKASLNNVAYATAQLHQMMRLEEGKSTQNIFNADFFAYIKRMGAEPAKSNESCLTSSSPLPITVKAVDNNV